MRVLITDVSEPTARDLARTLVAAGHEVAGLTEQPHRFLDPAVDVVLAAPSAPEVAAAVANADAVIHLGGADALPASARTSGVRVVLALPPGETAEVPAGALVVRAAPLVGRRRDASTLGTLAGILHFDQPGQVLHHDDLVRLLVQAVLGGGSGEQTLVASGAISPGDLRTALGEAGLATELSGVTPIQPVSELVATADVSLGWTAAEVLRDAVRGLTGHTVVDGEAVPVPGVWTLPSEFIPNNLPATDGGTLVPAGPPAYQGEFDTLIDPRLSVLTATNTSEALPRPMTPITVDLHLGALRYTNRVMGQMLALEGAALEQNTSLVTCVLGHSVYINASVGVNVVENMPGWDEESVRRDVYGNIPAEVEFRPQGGPPMPTGAAAVAAQERAVAEIIAKSMSFQPESERLHAAAIAEALSTEQIAALDDAALAARARLWRDRLAESWAVAAIGVMLVGAASAMHYAGEDPEQVSVDVNQLDSARTMLAVETLAALLRGDDELIALARDGKVDALCAASESFGKELDAQLAIIGHRGPGECELDNSTFGDRPALLTAAAAGATHRAAEQRTPAAPPTSESGQAVVSTTICRERARDSVVRYTHALRQAVREQGGRLVRRGVLTEPSDAFYLTLDEVFAVPADAAERVGRRREERARLKSIRMPDVVIGTWEPAAAVPALAVGDSLTGTGVFPGAVEGRVKVLRDVDDDIEPDDILVASVTDTGHTAMFGYASAVVTDIGGVASHAAIVAREFGVPCVVDTKVASTALEDGQWIRVDGASGKVTRLS
ncbi:hypothetical protein FXB39_01320 [Nocardioides sp. BGMRC 2183]|nr:hypothetical protein FXB39_01320 [Nocardioides sp. BGMRC 2183]